MPIINVLLWTAALLFVYALVLTLVVSRLLRRHKENNKYAELWRKMPKYKESKIKYN